MSHATHMLGLAQLLEGRELTQEDREALRMVVARCRTMLGGREVTPGDPYNEMYHNEYRLQGVSLGPPGQHEGPPPDVDVHPIQAKRRRSGER